MGTLRPGAAAPPVYTKCYKRPKRGIETKHFAKVWHFHIFSHIQGSNYTNFPKTWKGVKIAAYHSDHHIVSTLPGGVWAYFGEGTECTAFFFGYHVCYIAIFLWYGFESYLCLQCDVNSLKLFEASDRRNGRLQAVSATAIDCFIFIIVLCHMGRGTDYDCC